MSQQNTTSEKKQLLMAKTDFLIALKQLRAFFNSLKEVHQ